MELIASSAEWGVAKPKAAFFQRLCGELGLPAARVLYVGDQLGNDVAAPIAAGLAAVWIRRGPWGLLTADAAVEASALAVITSLLELPGLWSTDVAWQRFHRLTHSIRPARSRPGNAQSW